MSNALEILLCAHSSYYFTSILPARRSAVGVPVGRVELVPEGI